jgi:Putative prokaryotic signal transducing protein
MICPVCEGEYEPGITQCPTDDTPLVEKITSPHDESEASFVSLHNFGSPAEAEMVNDILTQNGVRSVVKSGGADAFSPLLSATSEGAMIMVDERDVDRAREVYRSFFGADTTPLTGGTTDDLEDEDEE